MHKYSKLLTARTRLYAYLRDNGIVLDRTSKGWVAELSMYVEKISGIEKTESHTKYQIRAADLIIRKGRDIKLQTPGWADKKEIKEIYSQCRKLSDMSGEKYHVDHIVPLKGKNVSGLHVKNNLRIIPAGENILKSNKY